MNCGLNRGCNNVTDCVADLDCCPHSPISPTCFTKYCHPGQAANVFGTCQELNPQISCNNGERSETETDVDCGGTQCLIVGNACSDGSACNSTADCTTSSPATTTPASRPTTP